MHRYKSHIHAELTLFNDVLSHNFEIFKKLIYYACIISRSVKTFSYIENTKCTADAKLPNS